MGSSDVEKSAKEKESKIAPAATQEQSSATSTGAVNPEWPVFQAFSPMPAHSYLASSPQPHPYMWGVQHIVPPYGAPHPYVAMYPHHGGMYAHPSMPPGSYPFSPFAMPTANGIAEASGNTHGAAEADGKSSEGKEKLPIKRSKGSLGSLNMIMGKNSDAAKASANGGYSKSGESGSEGSSDGSDANSQNDSQPKSGDRQNSLEAETSQNGSSLHGSQNGGSGAPNTAPNQTRAIVPAAPGAPGGAPGPATNLNIGMDYWGAPTSSSIPVIQGKVPSAAVGRVSVPGSRDVQPQIWLQDERELKRQRRKQSNRESARRSRLRKQAECDELAQKAEALKKENATLRAEVNRIRSNYEQLASENASLKERLRDNTGTEDARSLKDKPTVGKDA
ncbi:unnamed protein product [Rhodiola kirilowii]